MLYRTVDTNIHIHTQAYIQRAVAMPSQLLLLKHERMKRSERKWQQQQQRIVKIKEANG